MTTASNSRVIYSSDEEESDRRRAERGGGLSSCRQYSLLIIKEASDSFSVDQLINKSTVSAQSSTAVTRPFQQVAW